MKLSDFDFELPEHLIATRPVSPRSSARMLVADGTATDDLHFADLPSVLRPGDLLVLNNTKVIPARLFGTRQRGEAQAAIEVTLLSPAPEGGWMALVKPLRKLREGEQINFAAGLVARFEGRVEDQAHLSFNLSGDAFDAALAQAGQMPLPPYIAAKRAADARDKEDYQTLFARHDGAVAAPTASLHFDSKLMAELAARGVRTTQVTLHVGAGTFLPVKVEDVTTHKMHAEWGEVSQEACEDIVRAKENGGRVIAVGTTALRLIETAARETRKVQPWRGDTDIFIYPGFEFAAADGLITNFHLPKSTLMMLVAAFLGRARIAQIYDHAIAQNYRFFSYGDGSLLLR